MGETIIRPVLPTRTGGTVKCAWCDAFVADPTARAPWDQPLRRSNSFDVLPSLGALVPGWLLVVPRRHRLRLADCDLDEFEDLEAVYTAVRRELKSAIGGPVIAFEHGPSRPNTAVGCSVDHAHLHVVPVATDVFAAARAVAPHLEWSTAQGHFVDVLKGIEQDQAYLMLVDDDGLVRVSQDADLPSQLFRRAISELAGQPNQWNWRDYPRHDVVQATIDGLGAAVTL